MRQKLDILGLTKYVTSIVFDNWQLRVSAYRIVQLISIRKDATKKHELPITFKAFIYDQ